MLCVIKVCPDLGCEAVWHNCPKKHTKCGSCGGNIIMINENTYRKKFSKRFFQYDFETEEYYRPEKINNMKEEIIKTIQDLCSNFLYYDRKEDEDLTMEQLNKAVKDGEITIDEMVAEFRRNLEATFK